MLFSRKEKNLFDEEYYLNCYRKMFTTVNLIFRDTELAQDAVQEGMIRALENYEKLRDKSKACSWATRMAINYAKDVMKIKSRQLPTEYIDSLIENDWNKNRDFDPVGNFVSLRYDVKKVLAELNASEREILVLKYFLDYSTEEIALFLNMSTKNANQKLRRARNKYQSIAAELADDGKEECQL